MGNGFFEYGSFDFIYHCPTGHLVATTYKDNLTIVYKWAIYDLDDESLVSYSASLPSTDTISIPVNELNEEKRYRIVAKAYIKRKVTNENNCGNNYITSIDSYVDFAKVCNNQGIIALKMNEKREETIKPNQKRVCFKLPTEQISMSDYTVALRGPGNANVDMYYNIGSEATKQNGTRASLISRNKSLEYIDNSLEVFHQTAGGYAVYVTIFRGENDDLTKSRNFSITPRSDFSRPIKFVSSNLGNISLKCSGEMIYKMCTTEALNKYHNWIKYEKPDIINLQEVTNYSNCNNDNEYYYNSCDENDKCEYKSGKGIKYACYVPYYEERSICCNFYEYTVTKFTDNEGNINNNELDQYIADKNESSAAKFIFDNLGYNYICDDVKGYDCIAWKSEYFEKVAYTSGYPDGSYCDNKGVTVGAILLKEIASGRTFVVGNAHPEPGGAEANECRRQAMEMLFKSFVNDKKFDGIPENAIISGDFNMDLSRKDDKINYAAEENDVAKDELKSNLLRDGYEELGHAFSYARDNVLYNEAFDHVFSNFLNDDCGIRDWHELSGNIGFDHKTLYCSNMHKNSN